MTLKRNSFEHLAAGTALTTANSAGTGNDAFTSVAGTSATNTITVIDDPTLVMWGSRAVRIVSDTTNNPMMWWAGMSNRVMSSRCGICVPSAAAWPGGKITVVQHRLPASFSAGFIVDQTGLGLF